MNIKFLEISKQYFEFSRINITGLFDMTKTQFNRALSLPVMPLHLPVRFAV